MGLVVNDVVTRAGDILSDAGNVRWTVPELLRYISDGQRRIVDLIPAAYTRTVTTGIGNNNTMQLLPAGYLRLVDMVCNTNSSGTIAGRPISKIDRETLNVENVNWRTTTGVGFVEYYIYEPQKDPGRFYVYPTNPVGSAYYVEAIFSVDPIDVVSGGQLGINSKYHEPLVDYVLSRAFQKDGETGNDMQRSAWHGQSFMSGIGFKTGASSAT